MANEVKAGSAPSLQPKVIEDLVANQKRDLEIRAAELQLKAQQDKHGFEHAQKVLDAQVKDRQAQREFAVKYAWHRYVFVGVIVAVALFFLGVLVLNGHGAMAVEILKACTYLAAGAISGFFYGKSKASKPNNDAVDVLDDETQD